MVCVIGVFWGWVLRHFGQHLLLPFLLVSALSETWLFDCTLVRKPLSDFPFPVQGFWVF